VNREEMRTEQWGILARKLMFGFSNWHNARGTGKKSILRREED
jgi:hypothetical protein